VLQIINSAGCHDDTVVQLARAFQLARRDEASLAAGCALGFGKCECFAGRILDLSSRHVDPLPFARAIGTIGLDLQSDLWPITPVMFCPRFFSWPDLAWFWLCIFLIKL
jgi:hypothetical protein